MSTAQRGCTAVNAGRKRTPPARASIFGLSLESPLTCYPPFQGPRMLKRRKNRSRGRDSIVRSPPANARFLVTEDLGFQTLRNLRSHVVVEIRIALNFQPVDYECNRQYQLPEKNEKQETTVATVHHLPPSEEWDNTGNAARPFHSTILPQ